jgi:AraC family transcriptional regulator of adaptative response/methylated-DNA-[protein]-cysteine methyltransferase
MLDERYWQAVLTRDARMEGSFVYGVQSTGIYCRPTCPTRKPRREQVTFFTSASEAEQAGFRPCKRCLPRENVTEELRVSTVQRVCLYIEDHGEERLSLEELGQFAHMSPFHLQRVFKQVMGISPHQYAQACRLKRFKARLRDGEQVTSALYDAGYSSSSRVYEHAPARLGMTPRTYRRGGAGMQIYYTLTNCQLGRLLVAATERGVCAVYLGDNDDELRADLHNEYPSASIEYDGANMCDWVASIVRYLQGQQSHLDLPLDLRCTAFEWRVWKTLQTIPYGETRSYGEIAQSLGDAKKARAVAQACAHNPVALIIPCHRVVRRDGSISGYRWGSERKQQLLAQEQQSEEE